MLAENLRQNPIDSSFSYVPITDEEHQVQEFTFIPGIYGFIVKERMNPDPLTVTVTEDVTGGQEWDIITAGNPLAGQVRFSAERGILIFNILDNGKDFLIDYQGGGTNLTIEFLQDLNIGHIIEDKGVPLTQRTNLNFTGAGVIATDAGSKTIVDIPGEAINKTVWFNIINSSGSFSEYRIFSLNAGSGTRINFNTSDDFISLIELEFRFFPGATAAISGQDIDIFSAYHQKNNSWNQFSGADTTTLYDFTGFANKGIGLDISTIFSSLGAGMTCGARLQLGAGFTGTLSVLGIRMKYSII